MTKKHFVALADVIREHNRWASKSFTEGEPFTEAQIDVLAQFCRWTNGNFDRERWFAYIAGECGPSGGKIKAA